MKNGKREARKRPASPLEEKSRGTVWAEQTRARCNKLTEAERARLLDRAMQIAYGGEAKPAVARRR
mgnify:CR=1 FL=1